MVTCGNLSRTLCFCFKVMVTCAVTCAVTCGNLFQNDLTLFYVNICICLYIPFLSFITLSVSNKHHINQQHYSMRKH